VVLTKLDHIAMGQLETENGNGNGKILMYMCIKVKPLINDRLYKTTKTTSLQRLHSNLSFKMTKAYLMTTLLQRPLLYKISSLQRPQVIKFIVTSQSRTCPHDATSISQVICNTIIDCLLCKICMLRISSMI